MPPPFDRFILGVPRLFIKQYPYAWFPLVVMWDKSANVSAVLISIIVTGMLFLHWQSAAWVAHMRREHAGAEGKFYVDRPAVPRARAVKNIAILVAVSGLVAYLLQGRVSLNFGQLFFISAGFTLTYQDARFFGAPVTYIVTAAGIAVHFTPGLADFRLFLPFKEIERIERTPFQKDKGWDFFARSYEIGAEGLLLVPKASKGFSKRTGRLFIAPGNIEKFLEQLPYGFK